MRSSAVQIFSVVPSAPTTAATLVLLINVELDIVSLEEIHPIPASSSLAASAADTAHVG